MQLPQEHLPIPGDYAAARVSGASPPIPKIVVKPVSSRMRWSTGLAMPVIIWRIRPSSKKFTILPFFKKSSSTTFFEELDICQRGTWKTPSVLLHPPARRSQHTPWRPLPSGCMRAVATLRPKRAYPPHLYSITPPLSSRIGRTPPDGSLVLDQTFHPISVRIYNTIVDIVCLLLFSLIVY